MAFAVGDHVIVETSRGLEYGEILLANTEVEDSEVVSPLKKVVRAATEKDEKIVAENREREKSAFSICLEKIAAQVLVMRLVGRRPCGLP